MVDSYIFTGYGFVKGKFKVTNSDIEQYIKQNGLEGFDEKRIENSDSFKSYKEQYPNETPFNFMVEHKMGFKTRYNVVPFPPTIHKYKDADNSLDLCVEAIEIALKKSGLSGNDIDAWFVGTATAHQFAPGVAEFAKAYFTDIDNQSPTYSLTSACVGFNLNISNAVTYLETNPKANHILVAHTELMSALLTEEKDFVPFSTFGDSAAAVIVSRVSSETKQGIISIHNGEDTQMLDFLGADQYGNLYMNPRMVKNRAVPNITNTIKLLLDKCNWKIEDLLYLVPHQTGNAIVDSVAENIGIKQEKCFKEVQIHQGNLSGASIPAAFTILEETNRLKAGGKIITAVAGLGGEFGGFAYIVPDKKYTFKTKPELDNKTILITGASGGLGREIALHAAEKGGNLILQFNSNLELAEKLKSELQEKYKVNIELVQADLTKDNELNNLIDLIKTKYKSINYLLITHAITGSLLKATKVSDEEFSNVLNANYLSIKKLCLGLENNVSECFLMTGSVGEEAQFPGSTAYVASKRALRSFAVNFAEEVYKKDIRCVYYIPGVIDSGMVRSLNELQVNASLQAIRQKELTPVKDIALRMLKSTYRLKIPKVRMSYESKLKCIKDGFLKY